MSPGTVGLVLGLLWGSFIACLVLWAWRNWQRATAQEVTERAWEEWWQMEAEPEDMPAEEWV